MKIPFDLCIIFTSRCKATVMKKFNQTRVNGGSNYDSLKRYSNVSYSNVIYFIHVQFSLIHTKQL